MKAMLALVSAAAILLTACQAAPSERSSQALTSAIPEGMAHPAVTVAQRVTVIKDFEEAYTGNLLVFFEPAQKEAVLAQAKALGYEAYYQYDNFDAAALSPVNEAVAGSIDQVIEQLSATAGVLGVQKETTVKLQQ